MKAISLHQPWASLIAEGIKIIETRDWAPPHALVGQRIAIHATKRKPDSDMVLWRPLANWSVPRGAIVATAVLRKAVKVDRVRDGDAYFYEGSVPMDSYGDFSPGRWLWMLEDIERIDPPVPAVGHQGFWNWDMLLADALGVEL